MLSNTRRAFFIVSMNSCPACAYRAAAASPSSLAPTHPSEHVRLSQPVVDFPDCLVAAGGGALGDASLHPRLTGGHGPLQVGLLRSRASQPVPACSKLLAIASLLQPGGPYRQHPPA